MKEIVKIHPFRPIILRFDFNKPQLEFEKKGLEAHYHMHDVTWDMAQQLRAHYQALEDIDVQITELEYLLLPIEQDLDILEVFLQIQDPSVLPFDDKDNGRKLTIDIPDLYESIRLHNQRLHDLHADVIREYEWFHAHFDMIYEKESWIEESLWDDIHLIYRNYLQAQVDIVTLDRDQEEFRDALGEVFDFQDTYMEYGDTIFGAYNQLQERAEQCYDRSEVVSKGLNDLQG